MNVLCIDAEPTVGSRKLIGNTRRGRSRKRTNQRAFGGAGAFWCVDPGVRQRHDRDRVGTATGPRCAAKMRGGDAELARTDTRSHCCRYPLSMLLLLLSLLLSLSLSLLLSFLLLLTRAAEFAGYRRNEREKHETARHGELRALDHIPQCSEGFLTWSRSSMKPLFFVFPMDDARELGELAMGSWPYSTERACDQNLFWSLDPTWPR